MFMYVCCLAMTTTAYPVTNSLSYIVATNVFYHYRAIATSE